MSAPASAGRDDCFNDRGCPASDPDALRARVSHNDRVGVASAPSSHRSVRTGHVYGSSHQLYPFLQIKPVCPPLF